MADWFVDFSAANDGDGTAFGQAAGGGAAGAYNTLASKTFSSGDKVWIRRKSKTITATLTLSQGGAIYIGWPQSGDTYFSTRPAAAQASWDADAVGYAEVTATTLFTPMVSIATNALQEFHRMKFNCAYTGTSAMTSVSLAIQANFYNCWMEHAGTATSTTSQFVLNAAANGIFKNCTLTAVGTAAGSTPPTQIVVIVSANNVVAQFVSCNITVTAAGSNTWVIFSATTSITGMDVFFIDCTMSAAATTANSTLVTLGATVSGSVYMNNVSLDTECNSSSTQTQISHTSSTQSFFAHRFNLVKGRRIAMTTGAVVHFAKFNQTVASSDYAINTGQGVVVTGTNFSFHPGNTLGDIQPSHGRYYLRNCNFGSFSPLSRSTDFPGICLAETSVPGDFKYISANGEIVSSNVHRSYGEAYSLKVELFPQAVPATFAYWNQLNLFSPEFEIILATLPAAASTVTIYGAYALYGSSPPTKDDIWFDLDYYDSGSGAHRTTVSSKTTGTLTSDTSTWNLDNASLTPFKMSISVTPGQVCLCPIRLYMSKRSQTGYLYLDPKPVIT